MEAIKNVSLYSKIISIKPAYFTNEKGTFHRDLGIQKIIFPKFISKPIWSKGISPTYPFVELVSYLNTMGS